VTETERVPLDEVRDLIALGVALPFRVLDAGDRLLLNEGQTVGSERQFDALIERGAWVERARVEEVRRARGLASSAGHGVVVERQATMFDLWERALWDLEDLYRRLSRGRATAAEIDGFAQSLLALIDRDVDIALFHCVRQDDRRFALYAISHGLHCAVVGLMLSRQLGWTVPGQAALVRAALTMNVSMAELQAQMAEQGDPPTSRQLEQIRAHPMQSVQLLQDAGVTDADWLAMVRDHHERDDGSGYPRGLRDVGEQARLLRTVDIFMAKISPRARRPPMTPQNAARQQFQAEGGQALGTALIRAIGVHPPGTLVQLKSGEIGVVARRPPGSAAPIVGTLTNTHGQPVPATHLRDAAQPDYAITAALAEPPNLPRILPERFYGMALA
jgi:HD-GYP domain-containing protein (c-di-GMP phosphodiesterase class II)